MRPKRPLRGGLPGFNLNLPSQAKSTEVHVQQKAKDDLSRLFIDVDDTIESPMITTAPQFSAARSANGLTSASVHVSPPVAANSEAKFIHVHNTNIFVLFDGISMFLEGKSTFTGENDQLVSQHLQSKQRDRNMAKQQDQLQEDVRGMVSTSALVSDLDSVEVAIRNIERTAGNFYDDNSATSPLLSTSSSPAMGPATVTTSTPAASPTAAPDEFVSLFASAKKPTRPSLFRSSTSASLDMLASSMSSSHQGSVHQSVKPDPPALRLPMTDSCSVLSQRPLESSVRTPQCPLRGDVSASSPTVADTKGALSAYGPTVTECSSSSLTSLASTTARSDAVASSRRRAPREKPVTVNDIGFSNKTLDLDKVEFLHLIGTGSQGRVYCVRVDNKLYALKRIDVNEALEATNNLERHGRKKGLVKELHAIQMQSQRSAPRHLMRMFNAVVVMERCQLQLSILIELMSLGVEDVKNMAARLPASHVLANTQSTFKTNFGGSRGFDGDAKRVVDAYKSSSRRLLGRKSFEVMESWETTYERQTALPEIVLSMLAADILHGLWELHNDYHLVHCDLKPANVLLSFDRQCFKLTDFGCACVIDSETQEVRRSGVDLGSKLYKAPERLGASVADSESYLEDDEHAANSYALVFTAKADVWSLGILMLELSNGAHPCVPFKDNFWDYNTKLNLRNMLKPQNWSPLFSDFIVHCVANNPAERWSVTQLLKHPFIAKYAGVQRSLLKTFVDKLETNSKRFQREEKKKLLEAQVLASTVAGSNVDTIQSRINWTSFTSHLRTVPSLQDLKSFPKLE